MRTRVTASVGAALAMLAAAALAQPADVDGFGGVRLGMTAEQLRAALGDALIIEPTAIGQPGYAMDVIVARTPLRAQLLVHPGRGLTDIVVGQGFVTFSRERDAEAIENELRAMYGHDAAVINRDDRAAQGRSRYRELRWTFPSALILFRHSLEESPAGVADHLSVTFSQPR